MKKKILKPEDRLIISIDVSSKKDLMDLCSKIDGKVSTLKLGLELIYNIGFEALTAVKSCGYNIMFDSKLMDIPNTVKKAAAGIFYFGVNIITMHTLGGPAMISESKKILEEKEILTDNFRPLLFGVTILTSLNDIDLANMGFSGNYSQSVMSLVEMSLKAGIDGIICSPNEVSGIRKEFGNNFYVATPGIRLEEDNTNDQKRINTPEASIARGSDFIIVGRSITSKENIPDAIDLYLKKIKKSII